MSVKVKCSNCGTEISNLNFGWGKKQMILPFLFSIPFMLIGFFPLVKILYFKGDFRKELSVRSRIAELITGNHSLSRQNFMTRMENFWMNIKATCKEALPPAQTSTLKYL